MYANNYECLLRLTKDDVIETEYLQNPFSDLTYDLLAGHMTEW